MLNEKALHLIRKSYRKRLWTPFIKATKEYELIQDGDKIAVCISGGKDSFITALLFQELYKHGHRNFELEFLLMDPGYASHHKEHALKLAEDLGIPLHVYTSNIFTITQEKTDKPCYLCARMRRGYLYSYAKELGCNKIALGHHYDDVIETILMNVLSSGTYMTMMPKLKSDNFEGLELIRPLYLIRERHIISFTEALGLKFLDCACEVAEKKESSNRGKIKKLIETLGEDFKNVEASIFHSASNVHVGAVLGIVKDGEKHSFLETYDTPEEEKHEDIYKDRRQGQDQSL